MEIRQRERLDQRWAALKTERSSWMAHWEEISQYILPRAGRYFVTDRNKGERRHNKILDNTGTHALTVLAAGMMAGMTSPARPWFRLTTSSPELDESVAVKTWLADVTRIMYMIFQKSNTYRALHSIYEELSAFGTASAIVLPDFDNVIHFYTLTAGEYAIATDAKGRVNTLYREFQMTVEQMVGEFGRDACSSTVQNLFDHGTLDEWITVHHAIEPRSARDSHRRDAKNMPFASIYWEDDSPGKVLRESGYKRFPALCPRWSVSGGDIYGNSPAMAALGDIKQLQAEQLRKGQGIDYQTNPPLQIPTALEEKKHDTLPGGFSYFDATSPGAGIRSAFEVNLDLQYLLADIIDVRDRIKSVFYADLFLMLANSTNPQMTAREVSERHEEKLLMLGPVMERMQNELLSPLIDITFERMLEAGIVPEAPPELQGMELNVEFVSMLAQAQRAISVNSVDRLISGMTVVAGLNPEVIDKFNADYWIDSQSDNLGCDPKLIRSDDDVAQVRQQRAQALQAQQQQAAMAQGVDSAQKLGSIDTSKESALTDVTRAFSGYS